MTDYPNWFEQSAKHNFEHFLRLQGRQTRMECLQLGAYTGDASVWMLNNLGEIELTDVDTWEGSDEVAHESIDFDEVYNIYCNKVERFNNVSHFRTTTQEFLMNKRNRSYSFDFIYVDADHTTVGVLLDGELSWPLLKSGGIMAFDDYTWGHESGDPRLAPQVGIDLFLHRHQGEYELLAKNTQVWIRKQ
jgi:predicted O-methyltransferase YrrM